MHILELTCIIRGYYIDIIKSLELFVLLTSLMRNCISYKYNNSIQLKNLYCENSKLMKNFTYRLNDHFTATRIIVGSQGKYLINKDSSFNQRPRKYINEPNQ